VGLILITSAWI